MRGGSASWSFTARVGAGSRLVLDALPWVSSGGSHGDRTTSVHLDAAATLLPGRPSCWAGRGAPGDLVSRTTITREARPVLVEELRSDHLAPHRVLDSVLAVGTCHQPPHGQSVPAPAGQRGPAVAEAGARGARDRRGARPGVDGPAPRGSVVGLVVHRAHHLAGLVGVAPRLRPGRVAYVLARGRHVRCTPRTRASSHATASSQSGDRGEVAVLHHRGEGFGVEHGVRRTGVEQAQSRPHSRRPVPAGGTWSGSSGQRGAPWARAARRRERSVTSWSSSPVCPQLSTGPAMGSVSRKRLIQRPSSARSSSVSTR